ncbi:Kcnt2, partial [Symbiodinium microadriaticum]
MADLQRVRADIASAMFFVCNIEVQSQEAFFDDAATVLRTLSVSNFNSELECLVQVLRPEDRDILKDSNVDVIICLDEFKTTMQARNAICPGLSTLVENIFHSFGQPMYAPRENETTYWLDEYTHGARMELYYVPLEKLLMESFHFEWNLLVEGIFVEYGRILIGVCNIGSHSVVFNPGITEMKKYHNAEEFFEHYDVGVILAHEQSEANAIAAGLADQNAVDKMTARMLEVEADFSIRRMPDEEGATNSRNVGLSSLGKYSLNTQRIKIEKSFKEILIYTRLAPKAVGDVAEESHTYSEEKVTPTNDRRGVRNALRASPSPIAGSGGERAFFGDNLDVLGVLGIPDGLGNPPCQISDASAISEHIIVFGCVDYIHLFVNELRRPLIRGENYRPIVIVSEYLPNKWATIQSRYKDVYFLQEIITTSQGFNASNVRDAFAVILLASRDSVTMVEEENLDAETLFAYLKLERYIPRYVYFTVELTCSNNMAVLNSTIMRRTRGVKVTQKNLQKKHSIDPTGEKKSAGNDVPEHMQIK